MHRAQGRQIDAVLPFVVGGSATVNPVADLRRSPWIEIALPLALHAIDDIAVPIHQHGGCRRIFAVLGQQERALAGGRFDQPGRKTKLRKRRLQFLLEIGAQRIGTTRILAFGPVGDPAAEFVHKLAGVKVLAHAADGLNPAHECPIGLIAKDSAKRQGGPVLEQHCRNQRDRPTQLSALE